MSDRARSAGVATSRTTVGGSAARRGPMDRAEGLVVEDVTVRYGAATALDRFSLVAAPGEIVAVVGPSGSGKSTLLRAVAGLEPLAGGRIVLDGRDLAGVPTHRRGLGLMFQDHGLFTHLTVAGNIAYGLRTAGASKETQRARVDQLLDLVGLQGFAARRTTELSGGEAQRVALARALAPEPGLLMLDEPLGSLDRALREQLTGDLRRLLTGLGQTALHVTHDQAEAFAVADRLVVVSSAGRPVADGTAAELWADPGSRFVAEFLGHPNIWTVAVDREGAVSRHGLHLGTLPADHPLRGSGPGERPVVMPATGIRPALETRSTGSAGSAGPPTVEVRVTETVFRRGVNDVAAVSSAGARSGSRSTDHSAAGSSAGLVFRFTTDSPIRPDQIVTLAVDVGELRPLSDP